LIFDIGGVLELTPDTGWRDRWNLRDGPTLEALQPVFKAGTLGAMTLAEVERALAQRLALDDARLSALMGELWAEYLGELNHELMHWIRARAETHRLGIISNSFVGATERENARYGYSSLFGIVIYSHEVGLQKPDPAIFRLALERLGVSAEEAVFVDDVLGHVHAARAMGMRAVLFRYTGETIAELESILDD
jgi:putative hydrolase of the HAD superfamily